MNLAAYAVSKDNSEEKFFQRKFAEAPTSTRHRQELQRDRDRIVHSRAFRRLEYKTQVFVNYLGDNFRTRLTHSIEVSQISRTVANALGLNEDLVETLGLAHDLGHTPFGHAGERKLNALLKDFGGFEHNKQTLRIVEKLEERYPQYAGLNLTYITRLGLQKHDQLPHNMGHSLEAMTVDTCDEIAYNNHDIDDGIESGLLTLDVMQQSPLWKKFWGKTVQEFPLTKQKIQVRYTVRNIINFMINELVTNSLYNLEKYNINTFADVIAFPMKTAQLIDYNKSTKEQVTLLKKILHKNLYRHRDIESMNRHAGRVVERLYLYFLKHSYQLPQEYQARIEKDSKERVVADFVAGMTDRYALAWNERVDNPAQAVLPLEF